MRSSKLSMSMARNLRSGTGRRAPEKPPERSAMTPITKGSSTFFSEP